MKKYFVMSLVITLLATLVACGGQEESDDGILEEYVYVPEFLEFDMAENINSSDIRILGDKLYQYNYLYDIEARKGTDQFQILTLEGDLLQEIALGGNGGEAQYSFEHLQAYDVDAEGNVYTVEQAQGEKPDGSRTTDYYLCCYNDSGTKVFSRDITVWIEEDKNNAGASELLLDEEGRIYVRCQTSVKLFERDASPAGSISMEQGIYQYAMAKGKSGDVYVFYQKNSSGNTSTRGAKVDFETGQLGEEFGNLPAGGSYNSDYCPGEKGDFLINAGSRVYEYDIEAQSYEEVFTWLDCDIIESNVRRINRTEEGELYAVIWDWAAGIRELAFMRRLSASEVKPKTEIVLGLIYDDSSVQAAAVSFNKKNDEYRVVIRIYVDSSAGVSYEDGLTKLNLDITTGDSPDIFDLNQLNIEALTFSGAVEDLTPYLEGSSILDWDDYLENVLEGYTYGGKLAAIPHFFSLETMAGKTSELGEEIGWTLEEVLAYSKEHPQAELFPRAVKSRIMEFCLKCNMERFLDWESGEVKFDSEIFVELLEFVNSYPEAIIPQADSKDPPELLQSGEALLYPCSFIHFDEIQLYPAIFGQPVTFIGYPTADGSANAVLRCETLYGISAASSSKEGAWAFIESCLSSPVEWGFSPCRSQLVLQIEEAKEAAKDSSGEPLLDEDGNPLPAHGASGVRFSFDGKQYTYHACTDEEIGWVEELLSVAKPVKDSDSQVMTIIEEEVQAFYIGQKTAEDVAQSIQNRVQLYVDESR